ncbi:sensor histidine kinase [Levilactobacillus enshiensis]|uniref:sensor histidine kinase n=1 Tax=Levilactobacillus enshiensis TaxID=2590213 RepID=UPI00117A6882|nr:HAMP domain-containing sensor histidine kinase [Levilactobacillus enshiensis]
MSILLIITLLILVLILSSVLGFVLVDLRHITTDLVYINTHTTNAGVTSNVHFGSIQRLTIAMNQLLEKTRHLQQTEYQREHHLEQMLLNLTHDIKTPLTVATGYVQLIQQRPSAATPTTLQRVLDNLSSVNYYLRYLMDFNLVRTKANHLNLESVNVSRFLERELFNFFDDLTAKRIKVTPKISPDLYLTTDQLLLQRIIQNLVGNWLKYAADSATVSLNKADEQHLSLIFRNHTAERLTGDDTLTEQFRTTNVHSSQSLGLGLNIVRALVTTLGGKMTLKIEEQTFIVTLTFRTRLPVD